MPNEINNNLNVTVSSVADLPPKSKRAKISSSTATVSIWTISGILLAACTASRKAGPGDGIPTNNVQVIDGPVSGAAVYFDADGDGDIDQADREHEDNVDAFDNPRYVTDENGEVEVPARFATTFFVADVNGAIDTQTGEELEGEFHSFGDGQIATPISDLIYEKHQENLGINAQATMEDAATEVLEAAFGADAGVTLADVQNPDNYGVLVDDGTNAKAFDISRAALIITEIKQAEAAGDFNTVDVADATPQSVIAAILATVDDDTSNDLPLLGPLITARETAYAEIQGGKPLALPAGNVQIDEGDVLTVGEYAGGAQALFGFTDPGGNPDTDDVPSSFAGIYIDVSTAGVSFTALNDARDMRVAIAGDVLSEGEVAPTDNSLRPPGYRFISASRLVELEISATALETFTGDLEVSYVVFDGEAVSDTATLTIIVNDANDAPTLTFVGASLAPGAATAAGTAVAAKSANDEDDPTFEYSLTTTDADASEYAHNDLFEINVDTGVLTFIGMQSQKLPNGESYSVEITATESRHADGTIETATMTVDIVAGRVFITEMADGNGYTKHSSDAEGHAGLVEETTPASPTVLGFLRHDGAIAATTYALGTGDDSAEFTVTGDVTSGFVLNYIGGAGALGDREAADGGRKIVNIMVDLDGTGAAEPYQYIVTLTDVDDNVPVFASGFTGTISEAEYAADVAADSTTPPNVFGQVVVTDADATEAFQTTAATRADPNSFEGTYGGFISAAGGHWIYNVNIDQATQEAIDALGVGDTLTDTFVGAFTATDTNGAAVTQDLTFTITGTNDRPEITPTPPPTGSEAVTSSENLDPALFSLLSFTVSDADANDNAAINSRNFVVRENGDVSTLFEVYVNGPNYAIRLISGQSLDYETAERHVITVEYNDQSGADNAVSERQTFTINVRNLNDADDVVFSSAVTGTALVEGTTIAAGTLAYTALAANANFGGVVTYALSGADIALFDIDEDSGEVTFAAEETVNFETKDSYSFTITATSTDATTGTVSNTQDVTIAVNDANDVNDAPTLRLATTVLVTGQTTIDIIPIDPDADAADSVYTYAFATTGNVGDYVDNSLFSINAATGQLTFTGTAKAGGEVYNIEVEVTDTSGGTAITATQALTIIQSRIFVAEMADGSGYTKYSSDAEGHANLVEETTPSAAIALGFLGLDGATADTAYAIGTGDDSAEFTVTGDATNGYVLNYVGGELGDRDAADGGALTLNILVDIDGAGTDHTAQTYQYVVTLTDVDDNAPVFSGVTGTISEADIAAHVASFATRPRISGEVVITDADATEAFQTTTATQTTGSNTHDGQYGFFVAALDGIWTYRVHTDQATQDAIEALGVGETLTETFVDAYTATDTNGVRVTQTLTATITGTNDQPLLSLMAPSSANIDITAGTVGGTILPDTFFTTSDIDTSNTGPTINADGSIADITITEDGAVSDLFEIAIDGSDNIILRVKTGQTVGSDLGGGTPEHTLVINYDDGSGADNAISEDLTITIDIV